MNTKKRKEYISIFNVLGEGGIKIENGAKKYVIIDPMQKGVSLFLSYTNMNKMNSLHHMEEYPKISSFCNLRVIAVNVPKLELLKI